MGKNHTVLVVDPNREKLQTAISIKATTAAALQSHDF